MIDETGARRQESLREHPAMRQQREMNSLLRGIIMAVHYKDQTPAKQTLVDIALLGGYPNLYGAVMATGKASTGNGVEWTPEVEDLVLVAFINGNWNEPVVVSHLPTPERGSDAYVEEAHNPGVVPNRGTGSNVQANAADVPVNKRRYHFRMNGTDEQVDDSGNRITTVAGFEDEHILGYRTTKVEGNETLHVTGKGTLVIDGNLSVTILGTATIAVTGNTTLTSPLTTVNGDVQINGKLDVTGDVTTSAGNIQASGNILDQGGTKSMSGMRSTYNSHTHPENGTGGGTTSQPNQAQ